QVGEKKGVKFGVDNTPIYDAMRRHGVTEAATRDLSTNFFDDAAIQKTRATLAALIKDPPAFVIDFETAVDRVESGKGKRPEIKARLTGLEVVGDKASGLAIVTVGPEEERTPIDF